MMKLSGTRLSGTSLATTAGSDVKIDSPLPVGVGDLVNAGLAEQHSEIELIIPTPNRQNETRMQTLISKMKYK